MIRPIAILRVMLHRPARKTSEPCLRSLLTRRPRSTHPRSPVNPRLQFQIIDRQRPRPLPRRQNSRGSLQRPAQRVPLIPASPPKRREYLKRSTTGRPHRPRLKQKTPVESLNGNSPRAKSLRNIRLAFQFRSFINAVAENPSRSHFPCEFNQRLRSSAPPNHQPRTLLAQALIQPHQRLVQPPPRRSARHFSARRPNKNRDHRQPRSHRRCKRRMIGQPQVQPQPHQHAFPVDIRHRPKVVEVQTCGSPMLAMFSRAPAALHSALTCPYSSSVTRITPPAIFPRVAGSSHRK